MALENDFHSVEVPPKHLSERLGVKPITKRGRPHEVSENQGHGLPRISRSGGLGGQSRRAEEAKPRDLRVVLTATRTGCHERILGPALRRRPDVSQTSPKATDSTVEGIWPQWPRTEPPFRVAVCADRPSELEPPRASFAAR